MNRGVYFEVQFEDMIISWRIKINKKEYGSNVDFPEGSDTKEIVEIISRQMALSLAHIFKIEDVGGEK